MTSLIIHRSIFYRISSHEEIQLTEQTKIRQRHREENENNVFIDEIVKNFPDAKYSTLSNHVGADAEIFITDRCALQLVST